MEEKEIEYHEQITDQKEIKSLEEFKNAIATITDKKDKAVINPLILLDNDFLIHFLRARKLNVNKATKMILDYLHWKAKMNLDEIYTNYIFKEKYKLELLFPHGFHKLTKDGCPIYFQIVGRLNADDLFKIASSEEITKYSIQIYENLERDYFKICSKLKGKYIHGVFNIIDFKGIGTSILNKKLLGYIKETLKICQDYYPESLDGCYVINAGLLFRTFYTAVKVFLDSETKSKVKVFGSKYQQSLLEKIDPSNLPKIFGGTCECPGGCIFSNEGPWKKKEEEQIKVPDDILLKRKELNDILTYGKIQTSPEDEIKGNGKDGINPDDL